MPYDEKQIIKLLNDPHTRREAFQQIVANYSQSLYWLIRRIVIRHDDADDVLQNTFIKAWLNIDEFRQMSKISTWLHRIAVNEALDFVRKEKRKNEVHNDIKSVMNAQPTADAYFDGSQAQALLLEAVNQLPDVQRAVFQLKYYDNMKYSDMSEVLQTTEGALKASYHIAVKKIKAYVEQRET